MPATLKLQEMQKYKNVYQKCKMAAGVRLWRAGFCIYACRASVLGVVVPGIQSSVIVLGRGGGGCLLMS